MAKKRAVASKPKPSHKRFLKFLKIVAELGGITRGKPGAEVVYLADDGNIIEFTRNSFVGKGKNFLVAFVGGDPAVSVRSFQVGTLEQIRDGIADVLADDASPFKVEAVYDLLADDNASTMPLSVEFEATIKFPDYDEDEGVGDEDGDVDSDESLFSADDDDLGDDEPDVTESYVEEDLDDD